MWFSWRSNTINFFVFSWVQSIKEVPLSNTWPLNLTWLVTVQELYHTCLFHVLPPQYPSFPLLLPTSAHSVHYHGLLRPFQEHNSPNLLLISSLIWSHLHILTKMIRLTHIRSHCSPIQVTNSQNAYQIKSHFLIQ